MSAIPIRPQAPWGPRPAPRSLPMPAGGLGGFSAGTWTPAKLAKAAGGLKVPRFNPLKLARFGLGGVIGSIIAEHLAREFVHHLMFALNGLTFVRACDMFVGSDGYNTSTDPLSACFTGQGSRGTPLGKMAGQIASIPPASSLYFRIMGHKTMFYGNPRYNEQSTYRAAPTSLPVRPRPFYAPAFPRVWPSAYATAFPPGRVPHDVRPWPIWAGPIPGQDVPYPTPVNDPPITGARPGIGTGRRWEFDTRTPPVVRPVPENPAIPRNPPAPNEREHKIGANTPAGQLFMGLMKAREGVSEIMDLVQVLFQSLPKHIQRRYGGARATDAQMILALFDEWETLDGQQFLFNLIANQIEDEIIGKSYFKARAETSKAANILGANGAVSNPFFKEFAARVSDLSKLLAQAVMGGDSTYNKNERQIGDLLARAEQAYDAWLDSLRKSPAQKGAGQSRP